KDQGEWTEIFDRTVHQAADRESELMRKDTKSLEKLFDIYSKKEKESLINQQVFYPELGTSASKMKLIMMALNLGNEDNRLKLFSRRPVGVEEAISWNEEVAMGLLERNLTEKDWTFVQGVWDLLESKWPDISKLH